MRVRPLVSLLFFSSFAYADLGKVTLGISDLPSEIQELKGKTPQSVGEHLFEIPIFKKSMSFEKSKFGWSRGYL